MQAASPAISVVMPVFNRQDTVARSVESVLAQDCPDFEFVIVDDGSSDGTEDVVAGFRDARIRYLRQPANRGGNAARNRGIREALGEVVSFLDSDDVFLPHKLGHVKDLFAADPGLDLLIDSYEMIIGEGEEARSALRLNPVLDDSRAIETAIFARRIHKSTPSLSVRREAILRAGLFDETLVRRQDMDLVLRLARNGRCASTDAVLWRKYWSSDSISAQQDTFMRAMIDICDRHPEYISNRRFRVGLARDFTRHFLRLTWRGRYGTAIRDAKSFAASGYGRHAPGLVATGLYEIAARLFTRNLPAARRRRAAAPPAVTLQATAPYPPAAGAEEQSFESKR